MGASVAEAACERLPAPGLLVGDGVGAPLEVAAEVTEATPDAVVPALALPAEGVGYITAAVGFRYFRISS